MKVKVKIELAELVHSKGTHTVFGSIASFFSRHLFSIILSIHFYSLHCSCVGRAVTGDTCPFDYVLVFGMYSRAVTALML